MFIRGFGLLVGVSVLASIAGHLMKLAGVNGVDTFRWVSTATGLLAGAAIVLGIVYQRLKQARLVRQRQRVARELTPLPEPLDDQLDEQLMPLVTSGRYAAVAVAL